jgi:hypothetical protein
MQVTLHKVVQALPVVRHAHQSRPIVQLVRVLQTARLETTIHQKGLSERINALRSQIATAITVNRTAQGQIPIALAAADEAQNAANLVHEDNLDRFAELLQTYNLRAAELATAEERAVEAFTAVARIQADTSALINYRPPPPPVATSQRSERQEDKMLIEHKAMIDVIRDLSKDNTNINPTAISLLGKPAAARKQRRPSSSVLKNSLTTNNLSTPQDVDMAIKMAILGNYSYLVMNHETGMVDLRIFTPWHKLNEVINQSFIRFKCVHLTDTCMRALSTTSISVLLCGSPTPNGTFSTLLTRCNVFPKFTGDHSNFITATTIHEKIKKAINSVPAIRSDMLTYEKLIASENQPWLKSHG